MENNWRIAVISFIDPTYGHAGGATKNVQNSCNALATAGYLVDFYAFHNKNEESNGLKFVSGVSIVGRYCTSNNPFLFLKKYPFCVERRWVRGLMGINWSQYDLVLFEGEQVYRVYKQLKNKTRSRLIRMHDIESVYRKEIASSQKGLRRLLNRLESNKFLKIERELRSDGSYFGFVSTDELESFRTQYKGAEENLIYLPPFYNYLGNSISKKTGNYLIFFGDLSLENNYSSIKWYLENCFKPARKIKSKLIIHVCGNSTEKQKAKLESICEGIVAKGFVPNLRDEIEKAKFVVCPILYGAGVKIKLFEALSYGKLVLANVKALEGTRFEGGKHLVIADGAEEFTNETIRLFNGKDLPDYSSNLKQIFLELYSSDCFVTAIQNILEKNNKKTQRRSFDESHCD